MKNCRAENYLIGPCSSCTITAVIVMGNIARALEAHLNKHGEFAWYTATVDEDDQQHADIHVAPVLLDPEGEGGWNWVFQLLTEKHADYLYEEQQIWDDYFLASPEHDDDRSPPEHARDDEASILVEADELWGFDDEFYNERLKTHLEHLTGLSGGEFDVRRLTGEDEIEEAMGNHPMYEEVQERVEEIEEMDEEEKEERLVTFEEMMEEFDMDYDPEKTVHELRREVRLAKLHQSYYDTPSHTLSYEELERAADAFGEEFADTLLAMWEYRDEYLDGERGDEIEAIQALPDVLDNLT